MIWKVTFLVIAAALVLKWFVNQFDNEGGSDRD